MSYRPTRLTYLLIALVLIEIGLVVSLRQLGWWGTGDLLVLIFSVAAIALPIAIVVLILAINRFRLGLRSLFLFMVILSLFIALNLKPLLDYREIRRGSTALLRTQSNLITEDYFYRSLSDRSPNRPKSAKVIEEPTVWLPPWLSYFVRDIAKAPVDVTVISIHVYSNQEFRVLTEQFRAFPNLSSIRVSNLSEENFYRIPELTKNHWKLTSVTMNNPPVNERLFQRAWSIQKLELRLGFGEEAEIVNLSALADLLKQMEVLQHLHLELFEMDFDPALLSKLAESESLKKVSVGIRKKVNSEVWRNEETFDLDEFRERE